MIKAFNLSERYRVPVAVMTDAYVAHMKETVTIPTPEEIMLEPRRYYKGPQQSYLPFKRDKDFVPRMVDIGDGYRFHVTGLTHDDRGYPIMNEECQEFNVHPLVRKIRTHADKIVDTTETNTEDADVIIVSYGVVSRVALAAMEQARASGVKVGCLKLNVIWPFPEKRVATLAKKVHTFIVPELNFGQIVSEVERCSYGHATVVFVAHGERGLDYTDDIVGALKQTAQKSTVHNGVIEYKEV
jgi:2-oxoglutarate ferredoxin oxidoreductase subunit alpha